MSELLTRHEFHDFLKRGGIRGVPVAPMTHVGPPYRAFWPTCVHPRIYVLHPVPRFASPHNDPTQMQRRRCPLPAGRPPAIRGLSSVAAIMGGKFGSISLSTQWLVTRLPPRDIMQILPFNPSSPSTLDDT